MSEPMIIVLDATALRQYLPFDSHRLHQLETFVKANGHRLVVPQVVRRELKEHIAEEFRKIERAFRQFERQTRHRGDLTPPGEAEREQFTASLEQRLEELGAEIVPIPPIPHESIIDRIYERKAPFRQNEKNEQNKRNNESEYKETGYKDFLIWNTVLELARSSSGQEVVLITADGDFRQGSKLHPDLVNDADGLKVRLVKDFNAFLNCEVRPWFSTDEGLRTQLLGRTDEIIDFVGCGLEEFASWFPVDQADLPYASDEAELTNFDIVRTVEVSTVTRLDGNEVVATVVLDGCFGITDWFSPADPWQFEELAKRRVNYHSEEADQDHGMIFFTVDGLATFDIVFPIEDGVIAQPTRLEITRFTVAEPSP